jgi:hypothetical protein
VLSVIYNFTINRKFTFKSANNVPIAMLKVFIYYLVFTPLSIWWGEALTSDAKWNEYLVLFLTMFINMATEFLVTRYWVYGNSINSAIKDKNNENAIKNDGILDKNNENNNKNIKFDENNNISKDDSTPTKS